MRVISFDVSSSTIGWAILDIKKTSFKLYDYGFIKPIKTGHIFERLKKVKEDIVELLVKFKPNKASIEDISQYMPGISSANTIILLALFNRIVGLTVFEYLNEPPELYSVMAIRHGLKQTTTLPKKEEIPQLVENILCIKLPILYKKNGSIKDEYFDQSDAIACGLFHCYNILGIKRKKFKK